MARILAALAVVAIVAALVSSPDRPAGGSKLTAARTHQVAR